jgi:hypothetical protein
MNTISFKVKNKIVHADKTYLLLPMYENEILPEASVSNIVAIDKNGNLIWVIQPPTTKFDIYARMYFEEDKFFAVTSAGQIHQIDYDTGKIISSRMVK